MTGESEYRVEYRTAVGAFLQAGVTGADGNSLLFTGLAPSTAYQFRVRACNAAGCSAYSSEVAATTGGSGGGSGVPPIPTGLSTTVRSSSSILLGWTDVSGETEYRVEYRSAAGPFLQAGVTGADGNSLLFTGLAPSSAYQFRVRACNGAGCSSYSAEVSATTSSAGASFTPAAARAPSP